MPARAKHHHHGVAKSLIPHARRGWPARLRTPDSAVGGKRRRPGGATVLYGRSLRSTWHRRGVGGFAGKPDNSPTASQESIRRGAQPLTEPVFGATATDHSPQDGTRRHMRKPRSAAGGRCRLMGRGIWPMVILAVVAIVSLPPSPSMCCRGKVKDAPCWARWLRQRPKRPARESSRHANSHHDLRLR